MGKMEGPKICSRCGVGDCSYRCVCKGEFYCGPECQRLDWQKHKRECTVGLARKLREKRRKLGGEDAKIAQGTRKVGDIHFSRGKYAEAKSSYTEALRIFAEIYGEEHATTAKLVSCLARTLCKLGRFEEAVEAYERALLFHRGPLGREGRNSCGDVCDVLNGLGGALVMLFRCDHAIACFQDVLDIADLSMGTEGNAAAEEALGQLASACLRTGQVDRSIELYERATCLARQQHGEVRMRTLEP